MALSLIKLTATLKNISILPISTVSIRLSHQIKELKNKTTGEEEINTRQIFELLKTNNNPSDILANIEANKNKINGNHIVVALTSMQKFYHEKGISPFEVQKQSYFIKICSSLNKYINRLDSAQIIQALKILNLLKVSSSTMIMQSIFQLLRCSVNDLSLDQIYFLSFILKNIEPTPLSEAIHDALPEVFKAQLQFQLDKEDIKDIQKALRYASDYIIDIETIKYITDAIYNYQESIDIAHASKIFWSLSNLKKLPNNYLNILYCIQDILIQNVNQLNEPEVMKILLKSFTKIENRVEGFYNPLLINALINKLIADNYGFLKGIIILNKLNKIQFINISLLNYLSTVCFKNPSLLSEYKSFGILSLTNGLANANYKPPFWTELQKAFLELSFTISDDVSLCYFTLYLLSLDCFDSKLIEKVLTSDQNAELLSHGYHEAFQLLYQSVKTLYPMYTGAWPSEQLIQSFKTLESVHKSKDYLLLPILEKVLGNPAYVKTNLKTKLGHDIDHLIVLQDDNPISVEPLDNSKDSVLYVEDLSIPPNSKKLIILLISSEAYGKNIPILQAPVLLKIKSLEAMSYKVKYLSMNAWMTMPDFEKIPYIKYLIGIQGK